MYAAEPHFHLNVNNVISSTIVNAATTVNDYNTDQNNTYIYLHYA